jgi:hypothetical protein
VLAVFCYRFELTRGRRVWLMLYTCRGVGNLSDTPAGMPRARLGHLQARSWYTSGDDQAEVVAAAACAIS